VGYDCYQLKQFWIFHLSYFFPSSTFTIFLSSLSHTVLSTLLILAVCRTRVITNSVNMTSLATRSPSSSVARAPDRCTGTQIFPLSHARRTEYSIFLRSHLDDKIIVCRSYPSSISQTNILRFPCYPDWKAILSVSENSLPSIQHYSRPYFCQFR